MVLKLYAQDMSPTCRSVYLTAAALGLKYEFILIDVWKKQQFSESFLKVNPDHTIPTLDDNGTIIWDSNAINIYLVSKYGKDDSLYPKDCAIQAVVNQRLFYNAGVVFPTGKRIILKVSRRQPAAKEDLLEVVNIFDTLEKYLQVNQWVAHSNVTIADFALITNITNFTDNDPLNPDKYPKLLEWIQNMKQLPYFHVVEKGMNDMHEYKTKQTKVMSSL